MSLQSRSTALIASLLHHPIVLPNIRSLELTRCTKGPNHASMRHFIRRRLPVIAYHNPDIAVKVVTKTEKDNESSVIVETTRGQRIQFVTSTAGTRDSQILQQIEDINDGINSAPQNDTTSSTDGSQASTNTSATATR